MSRANCLRGLEVYHQFELRWLFDWQVGKLRTAAGNSASRQYWKRAILSSFWRATTDTLVATPVTF
jgi:hypothetical protein